MKSTRDLIAEELRSIRARKQLSLEIVAEKSGVSIDTIRRYENNQTSMNLEILERLLKFYEKPFDIFFTEIYANKQNAKKEE